MFPRVMRKVKDYLLKSSDLSTSSDNATKSRYITRSDRRKVKVPFFKHSFYDLHKDAVRTIFFSSFFSSPLLSNINLRFTHNTGLSFPVSPFPLARDSLAISESQRNTPMKLSQAMTAETQEERGEMCQVPVTRSHKVSTVAHSPPRQLKREAGVHPETQNDRRGRLYKRVGSFGPSLLREGRARNVRSERWYLSGNGTPDIMH